MEQYEDFARIEKKGWHDPSIVDAYVDRFSPVTNEVAILLAQKMRGQNPRVLDLCCGQGYLTGLLTDTGAEVSGLDFSPAMIELAERTAPLATFVTGDAAKLPYDQNTFDLVVCNFGMMHLPDQPTALSEIHRVLRPGGQFVMATWVCPGASPAFSTVFGAIKAHADFSRTPMQPDLFAFAERQKADEMFKEAGFVMTTHETVEPAWVFVEPEELFKVFLTATVGARMLIKSQSEATIRAIEDQVTETVKAKFLNGSEYRVPATVAVISGRK